MVRKAGRRGDKQVSKLMERTGEQQVVSKR